MLSDNLPAFAAGTDVTAKLLAAEQPYTDALFEKMTEERENAFVSRASAEGLSLWEELLGFEMSPGWAEERRRERIKARLLAAQPLTKAAFKTIVENTAHTETEIYENAAENTVTVRFTGIVGVSPYLSDIEKELSAALPAHLRLVYEWIFVLNSAVGGYTHGQLSAHTHYDIRNGGAGIG